LNIAAEIQKLKRLRDRAEGQIDAYEKQKKELAQKYKNLSQGCEQKYGCSLDDLESTLEEDEKLLVKLVNKANQNYNSLVQTDDQN
jgi:hypothetical protein